MLDNALSQQFILTNIPERFPTLRNLIKKEVQENNFQLYDIADADITKNTIPPDIKGAFIFLETSFQEQILLYTLTKKLLKVFVFSENTPDYITPSLEVYDVKYKKIGERIKNYLQLISCNNEEMFVVKDSEGYTLTLSCDVKVNPFEGLFIAIDYPKKHNAENESIGTILSKNIEKELRSYKNEVMYTNEPTGEITGALVKTAQLGRMDLSPDTIQLLYTADRIEHMRSVIPHLQDGTTVITARFVFSSLAFSFLQMPYSFLLASNAQVYWPDINFLLIYPKDSMQYHSLSEDEKNVNDGLAFAARYFSKTTYVLNPTKGIDTLTKQAMRIIKAHYKVKDILV